MRITIFIGSKDDFAQAVINERDYPKFSPLGFVRSVDDLPESESGSDYEGELRSKIRVLGGKAGGRSSIETLEKQLAKLESEDGNPED